LAHHSIEACCHNGLREHIHRLRAENERLRTENTALRKELCQYQIADIGNQLIEEMDDES
jgi:regulator of replication initiation timing